MNKVEQLSQSIAKDWLNKDQNWKNTVEKILEKKAPEYISDEEPTSVDDIVKELKEFINGDFFYYVGFHIYSILEERELFNEKEWEAKIDLFKNECMLYLNDKLDNIADNAIYDYIEDREYSASPTRYFGHSDSDF